MKTYFGGQQLSLTRLQNFSVLCNDGQGPLVLSEHRRQGVFRAVPGNTSRLRLEENNEKKTAGNRSGQM